MRFALLALCVLGLVVGVNGQSVLREPVMSEISLDFHNRAVPFGTVGLTAPVIDKQVSAVYTPEAMRARVQGTVDVDIVIDSRGQVVRARVAKSLDDRFGLDDNAIFAARQWTFKPGQAAGKPVFVIARISVSFRLH